MNTPHAAELTSSDLLKTYPQLSEKASIDFVNCLEVSADHLRVRDQRSSLGKRLFHFINGESDRRQQQIDKSHQVMLQNAHQWLQHLNAKQASSDLTIGILADKLTETRAGIMRLQQRLQQNTDATQQELKAVWDALAQQEQGVRDRFSEHEQRLQRLELKTAAKQQAELLISRWRDGWYAAHGLGQRLFLVCNALNWGAFGEWLRTTPASKDRDDFIEIVRNQLKEQLKHDSHMAEPILSLQDWFAPPKPSAHASEHQNVLSYLSESYQQTSTAPLPRFAGLPEPPRLTDPLWAHLQLPRLAGPDKLVRHMLTQTALNKEMLKC